MTKLVVVVSFLALSLSLSTLTVGCGDSDGGSTVTDDPSAAAGTGGSGGSSGAGNSTGGTNSAGTSGGHGGDIGVTTCASDPQNGQPCPGGHYGCSGDGKALICIPSGGTGGTGGSAGAGGSGATCSPSPTVVIRSFKDTGCSKQEFKIGGAISTSGGVHLFESYPTTTGTVVTGAEVLLEPEATDCGPTVGTFTSLGGYSSVSSSLEAQFYRFNAAQLDILWQKEQGTTPQVDTRYSVAWKKMVNASLRCHLGLGCTLGSSLPAGLITNEGGGTSSNLALCQEFTYGFVRN